MTSIFLLASDWHVFGDEEARRKGRNPRQLELFSSSMKSSKKSEKEDGFSFYRKQGWVPQLMELVMPKTSSSGPRISSMKREEMFVKIYSFQEVHISWVSEIWKFMSRFCVKSLFYP